MPTTIIKEGDKDKQGNATCPQCGETALIEHHFGDPPECGKCGVPYTPTPKTTKFS